MGHYDGAQPTLVAAGKDFMNQHAHAGTVLVAGTPGVVATATRRIDLRGAVTSAHRRILVPATGCFALIVAIAFRNVSYRAPTVRTALETMITLFAFAAAWLLRGQIRHSRRYRDLLLATGAAALGLANLASNALPAALELHPHGQFMAVGLWSQLVVGGIFATAAFVPSDQVLAQRRSPGIVAGLTVTAVLVSELVGLSLVDQVVGGTTPDVKIALLSHPFGLLLAILDIALLIIAAVGFQRREFAVATQTATMLAIAVVLIGAAILYHLASGTAGPEQLTPGDGFRILAFALLLIVAVRGEVQARTQVAKAAALAERQRVARDLHDGLAQDLAFIAAHGRSFAAEMGDEHPIVIAAKRALAISRGAISELSNPEAATISEALDAMAHDLQDRLEIGIAIDAHLDADVAPNTREDLTRIAREAIANAVRHGGAQNILVSLKRANNGLTLRVVDDGCGICGKDGTRLREGFGLRSMRERTAALGGRLTVDQAGHGGTELEVIIP